MPGLGQLGSDVSPGNAYNLLINNVGMNQYVEADRFDGYKQQCESESIWDFWTDNIDITLDVSALGKLGYDESNFHLLEKAPAALFYYGRRVFGGVIGDISLSKDSQSIELELHSYGRVIKGISGSFTRYGYSAQAIAQRIIQLCNEYLTTNDYPFNIDRISMDIIDFPFYKSLKVDFSKYYSAFNPFPATKFDLFKGIYYRNNVYYLVFTAGDTFQLYDFDVTTGEINGETLQFPIVKTTLKNYHTGNLTPVFDDKKKDSNGDPLPDEDNLPEGAVDIMNASLGKVVSIVPDGNNGYFAGTYGLTSNGEFYDFRLTHLVISEDDVFWCKYEDAKAGEMLKDLAIMTNAYVWVGPDRTLYFQTRNYGSETLDAVNPINYSSSIIRRDNDFKIPNAYLVLEDVKDDVTDYFNTFLAGDFYGVKTSVFKDEISDSNYLILLKDLPLKPSLQKGVIKSANFIEDVIEIESEFRING